MTLDLTRGDTRAIIDCCRSRRLPLNQIAYVLATAHHETGGKMKPVREGGGEKYLRAKKYYPFVGMGYVQLTWLENYQDWSKRLGVDFVANPKLLLKPEYAVQILVDGMRLGTFTGKKLSDYITATKADFTGARRIVNGTDKAVPIAGRARDFAALLAKADNGASPSPEPKTDSKPGEPLRRGATGKYVTDLQVNLGVLGYFTGAPTGAFDEATEEAVRAFQRKAGLLADGVAGIRTNTAIGEALKSREVKPAMAAAKKVVDDAAAEDNAVTSTELAAGAAAVSGTAAAVDKVVDTTDKVTDTTSGLIALGPWVLLALVVIGAAGYIIYERRRKKAEALAAKGAMG